MPSEDTWYALHDLRRNVYSGRIRSWNNTPNFGSVPKDQRPVNGYSDQNLFASQEKWNEFFFGWNYTFNRWDLLTEDIDRTITLDGIYSFQLGLGDYSGYNVRFNSLLAGVEDELKLKALVKIADAKVNVAVTYAEAHKTSDLILDTARRIDRAYRAFRRGDLKGVARNLNITPTRLHKSWLEYKYGWLPLLMDVKGAAEFFAQQHVVRPPQFTVVATKDVALPYFSGFGYTPWGGPPQEQAFEQIDRRWIGKVKVWCELTSPHLSELQQIGLTNPALVAWELVPFSFVFDWFISVGDWLTGLTALQGVSVKRAFYSQVTNENWEQIFPGTSRQDTSYKYVKGSMHFRIFKRTYTRVPLELTSPELPPVATGSFGFPKLVTSLALLKSGYRGNARL